MLREGELENGALEVDEGRLMVIPCKASETVLAGKAGVNLVLGGTQGLLRPTTTSSPLVLDVFEIVFRLFVPLSFQ